MIAISTHVPTQGATISAGKTSLSGVIFKLTRPRKARQDIANVVNKLSNFNSRAHARRDLKTDFDRLLAIDFNSRAHARRDATKI